MNPVGWILPAAAPAWLAEAPDAFSDAATRLRTIADRLDTVRFALRAILGESAVAAGWSGLAAREAARAVADRCDQLSTLRDLVMALGRELSTAAARLDQRRDELVRVGSRALWEPANPLVGLWAARELDRVLDDMHVDDRAAAASIDALTDGLQSLASPINAGQWVESIAPDGSTLWLRERGVLPAADVKDLVRWAATLPGGHAATMRLRDRLYAIPANELPGLLDTYPSIATRIAADTAVPAVLAKALGLPAGPARTEAVREAIGELPLIERRSLALLDPSVIGPLAGAPIADRVAANRVLIRAALDAELASRAAHLARLDRRENHTGPVDLVADTAGRLWDAANDLGPLQAFVDDFEGDPAARAADSERRIALYRSLLAEGRQVLVFDPRGDGTIAELFGTLDGTTPHVAVLVPGTGMDFGSYETWAGIARDFHHQDPSLTTISWLGADFPDTLSAAALQSYAEHAGPRLRDFLAGLDVPAHTDATVIGYSYGGAVTGVAERVGLVADRVLHVESAGAGAGVETLGDYAGGVREHYTMTAPGDPISYVRGMGFGPIGHGADPDEMAGFVRVPTGCYGPEDPDKSSERIAGLAAHWDVFSRGSTAWESMYAVMTGRPPPGIAQCRS